MLRGLFVTGTDTNVGKTAVAAALMYRYRHLRTLRYWKPIQTGTEQADDTETVRQLAACQESQLFDQGIRLQRPLSPHLAAESSGTRISMAAIDKFIAGEAATDLWVVEGAGGVLVPLNESELMVDLMLHFAMPVLVVARSTLGTINHTLLTIEALRRRKLLLAGVVMVGERNHDNRRAIERHGDIAVIGEMPHFSVLTTENLCHWASSELDLTGRLSEHLR
jgi:dethiobiotin synthetase